MDKLQFHKLSGLVSSEAEKSLDPKIKREILIIVAGQVRQLIDKEEEI